MVRVITRGGVGELSDPLVRRTNPSAPGSPPIYLEVSAQVTIQPINHLFFDSLLESENVNTREFILNIFDTPGQLC